MRDFQNAFDAALAGVDSTIVEVMGLCAQFTSGAQCGSEVQGVFDDPESLGFAGGGVRIEGSSPSLFVRTDTVRAAVLDALEQHEHGATLFDGRPVVFDEEDFPAIAVYLTDAEYTGEELDADTWRATLHIEVFLPAQVPDSELDQWMESRIYPAMTAIPALAGLITTMVTQGYEYRRDDDMALWSSADLTYSITYEM